MTDQTAPLSFGDYVRAVKRRGRIFCATLAIVVLAGVAFAFRYPPLYESTGVLLAEEPEVPEYVVRSTVPNYPEERVRIITQRVLTQENLERIVAANELYPELAESRGAALEEFRNHLALSSEDPELLENVLGASRAERALAFSIQFRHASPTRARDVARDLVALYLEENQRARRNQATATAGFLTQEAERLKAEIAERETRLAEFKSSNAGSLPELQDTNLELMDRTERDLDDAEREIRTLRERQALYRSELSEISPHAAVVDEEGQTILGPQDRLRMLQRRYAQLSAVYSQDHPDVLTTRREIEALSGSQPGSDREALEIELTARLDELTAARDRYSADHPDVRRLERLVAGLRASLAEAPARSVALPAEPDNPAYLQRQVQLAATDAELRAALERRDRLRERMTELEGRLTTAPEVERAYNVLNRGYEQLLSQYGEVEAKLREAEIAVNLETESRGERFTVLSGPSLPRAPVQPNRIAVLLLTAVLAVGLAAGAVAVAESRDTTVRNAQDLRAHLDIPPLVAIPHIDNPQDLKRRGRDWLIAATATGMWLALIGFFIATPTA